MIQPLSQPLQADLDNVHPDAMYRALDPGSPRVLLIDVAAMRGRYAFHPGHQVESLALMRLLDARDLRIAGWANSSRGLRALLDHDATPAIDAVVVCTRDGADSGQATEAAMMARVFSGRGKQVLSLGGRSAPAFDLLPVGTRDGGIPALCWTGSHIASSNVAPASGPVALLDGLDNPANGLAPVATQIGMPFFVTGGLHASLRRAVLSDAPDEALPRLLTIEDLPRYEMWVSTDFTSSVLALGSGIPVIAFAAPTDPLSKLYSTIGLDDRIIDPSGIDPVGFQTRMAAERPWTDGEWDRVARYRARAEVEIAAAFDNFASQQGSSGRLSALRRYLSKPADGV